MANIPAKMRSIYDDAKASVLLLKPDAFCAEMFSMETREHVYAIRAGLRGGAIIGKGRVPRLAWLSAWNFLIAPQS